MRRVGLLESGVGGPVIVGRAASADVLRLAGFLSRNGHPHHELDAGTERDPRRRVAPVDAAISASLASWAADERPFGPHPRRFCSKKFMVRFQARSAAALS
jgi:hypothetical protein